MSMIAGLSLFGASQLKATTPFPYSIVPVGQSYSVSAVSTYTYGRIVRSDLTPNELAAEIDFDIELVLSNRSDLEARVNRGEVFSREALEPYLPTAGDYARVRVWLVEQGFEVTLDSSSRHAIFVHGSYARIAAVFGVTLARVATADGEFTSAVSAPSLPDEIAAVVAGIKGLQPHLIRHPHSLRGPPPIAIASNPRIPSAVLSPQGQQLTATGYALIAPAAVAGAYDTPVALTGAGETIAIIGDTFPTTSDLTHFWTLCGIPQSVNNISFINVGAGPAGNTTNKFELSLDSEWTSGLAPSAQIRIYGAPYPLNNLSEAEAYAQILNDLPSFPNIHQVTESYGGVEFFGDGDGSLILLIAQGVTCFASAGDGGSNPGSSTGTYSASNPLAVEYPSSDPSVTGVGGTTLTFPTPNGGVFAPPEVTWSLNGGSTATGGGISELFSRPSWQVATGVPPGTMRCVPDISAMAYFGSGMGPLIYDGGVESGYGTSLSSPIWAGLCALMNQSRAGAGLAPLGSLNPKLYPAVGTSSFTDITSGSNGAYSAGTGYDLCTGAGTPVVSNLITYLSTVAQSPWIYTQPANLTVASGFSAQFSVVAGGYPQPAYQWQVSTNGGSTWMNLSNAAPYSGTTTAALTVAATTVAKNGYEYRCVATNASGSTNSKAAILTVEPAVSDFNGDGNTDLVLENTQTGAWGIWLMNGTSVASWISLGNIGNPGWAIVAAGDFNGDGKPDLVLENTLTGDCGIWLMNGTSVSSWVSLGNTGGPNWAIVAASKFTGSGQTDLVLQNTVTGDFGIWLMNGTTVAGWVPLGNNGSPMWKVVATGDFYGNGQTDLVLENSQTGAWGIWLMNGTALVSWDPLGNTGSPAWMIIGAGSFNGDGKPDLVLQNTQTGACGIWLMNGTTIASWAPVGNPGTEWWIAGLQERETVGTLTDFNRDGKPDLVLENTQTGACGIWLMNGTTVGSWVPIGNPGSPAWAIVATGDFIGDGNTDLVLDNTLTGDCGIWLMNGTSIASWVSLGNLGSPAWRIVATGVFNGDGNTDMVLQNTQTGDYGVWLMNGTTVSSWVPLGNPGSPAWAIVAAGDFNGDGNTDLVLENTLTGDCGIWLMNGTTITSWVSLGNIGSLAWTIVAAGDFNGDGKTDLVLENTLTGDYGIWLMNGTAISSWLSLGNIGSADWTIRN